MPYIFETVYLGYEIFHKTKLLYFTDLEELSKFIINKFMLNHNSNTYRARLLKYEIEMKKPGLIKPLEPRQTESEIAFESFKSKISEYYDGSSSILSEKSVLKILDLVPRKRDYSNGADVEPTYVVHKMDSKNNITMLQ